MRSLVRGPERQVPEAAVDRPAQDLTAASCLDFDLALTLRSGQVFRWADLGNGSFGGWLDGSFARVSQREDRLLVQGSSEATVRNFFSLDVDLPALTRQIDVDPVIHEALRRYPGLRVIRQDPWECAVSFMLSAYNNIPRLTSMIEQLCVRFGKAAGSSPACGTAHRALPPLGAGRSGIARTPRRGVLALSSAALVPFPDQTSEERDTVPAWPADVPDRPAPARGIGTASAPGRQRACLAAARGRVSELRGTSGSFCPDDPSTRSDRARTSPLPGGGGVHSFPRPEALANVSERALRSCGLGYRAPYLRGMAQKVASGQVDLEKLRDLEDEPLRRALLSLPGIGEKVVECVMLFAYGRGSAFPVDVWIGRAMREWYFRRRKTSDKKIREFARKHFGPRCGWAQQYLYCLARWRSRRS